MGLDQYLIRMEKLTDGDKRAIDELASTPIDWTDNATSWERSMPAGITEACVYKDAEWDVLLRHVMGFIYKKSIDVYDWDQLGVRQKLNIPINTEYFYVNPSGRVSWQFMGQKDEHFLPPMTITEKVEQGLVSKSKRDFIYWKSCEIGYWRKEYDLQEAMYETWNEDHEDEIKNCGYYPLTEKMRRLVLRKRWRENNDYKKEDLLATPDTVVCYHEWY